MWRVAFLIQLFFVASCSKNTDDAVSDVSESDDATPTIIAEEIEAFSDAEEGVLSSQPAPESFGRMRLMTWNLEWFPGRSPASTDVEKLVHVTAAREILAEFAPDILCIQEVLNADAVEDLVLALPEFKIQVISQFRGNQQIAIASRIAPIAAYFRKFETTGASPPRGFAFAAYREPEDNSLLFVYSVHLKSNRGGIEENMPKREESAKQLCAHVDAVTKEFGGGGQKITVILGGDFNTDPIDSKFAKEGTHQILTDYGFNWTWKGVRFEDRITWVSDGAYPDACFDHFYTLNLDHSEARALDRSEIASDHKAVILDFD